MTVIAHMMMRMTTRIWVFISWKWVHLHRGDVRESLPRAPCRAATLLNDLVPHRAAVRKCQAPICHLSAEQLVERHPQISISTRLLE